MAAIVTSYLSNNPKFLKNNNKVMPRRKHLNRVAFVSASTSTFTLTDPYQTLRINFGADESEVKKAFRRLALKYHPDVCREDNCTIKFHQINEAYDTVMNNLREAKEAELEEYYDEDLWEEWMGWEGAGIRDYTSHVNPYI